VVVRIDAPRTVALSDVAVRLNGADVTPVFMPDSTGNAIVGLVTGYWPSFRTASATGRSAV
jgi:hypothetical protein